MGREVPPSYFIMFLSPFAYLAEFFSHLCLKFFRGFSCGFGKTFGEIGVDDAPRTVHQQAAVAVHAILDTPDAQFRGSRAGCREFLSPAKERTYVVG